MRRWRLRAAIFASVLVMAGACSESVRRTPRGPAETVVADGWKTLESARTSRTEVTAAELDGKIYVIGGLTSDGETVNTVEIYDPRSDTYQRGPDLPVKVNHPMSASLSGDGRGSLYVFGGYEGPTLASPSTRVFVLDGGSWRELRSMPEPRAAAGAAIVGTKAVIAGGVDGQGMATSTLVYDIATDRWSVSAGLGVPREHLGVASDGMKVFAVGGRAPANLATAEAFDPSTGTWTRLPDMPTARGGLAAAFAAGLVVAPGGEAEETFPEVEAYDVKKGSWISLPPMPTPRHGLGVVALGDTIYTLCGGPRPGLHVSGTTESLRLRSP